jgi:predicted acylesterase/phospholipase RssA
MVAGPLGRIALALSGGGYRAAAFHLGTLRALNDLKLLDYVRVLSTASGGSITGAAWAVSIAKGETFEAFERMMSSILEQNIVAGALDLLNVGSRRPSLIQRAAVVYDRMFAGQRLGELASSNALRERLDHVIINATHFSLGYGFRFTFPPRARSPFGNRAVKISNENAWRDVRLADAVAASSCFPAGFEPMLFPDDFVWTDDPPVATATGVGSKELETKLPLMDGGIYDNQAIDALLLIDEAASATPTPDDDIGLLFCSDTDQKQMPFYLPMQPGRLWRLAGRVPCGLAALILAAFAAALAWLASAATGCLATTATVFATLFGTPIVALAVVLVFAQWKMSFRCTPLWRLILKCTVGDVARLLAERVASVLALTTKVFMYRIRDLGYEVAYLKMPSRVVASHIYDAVVDQKLGASPAVIKRAEQARSMDTTLWMTDEQREYVTLTGYASAVGALLRYLHRWRSADGGAAQFRPDIPYPTDLAQRVEEAWDRINASSAVAP